MIPRNAGPNEVSRAEPLVYGEIDGVGLVFIPAKRARELALLNEVLPVARTWGELRDLLDERLWAEIQDRRDAYDVARSTGAEYEPFDPEQLTGFSAGAWPSWPAQDMLKLLPHDILAGYGKLTDTLMSGTFVRLFAANEVEIVAELEERGWKCEKDEALVLAASGYD